MTDDTPDSLEAIIEAFGEGPYRDFAETAGRIIQRKLAEHDGNISATARALKMHRRTLQRKLAKRRPPDLGFAIE